MSKATDSTERKTVPSFPRVRPRQPVSQIREKVMPQVKEGEPPTDEAGVLYSVVHPRTPRVRKGR